MNPEIREEAIKQFFKYFRWFFLVAGIMIVVTVVLFIDSKVSSSEIIRNTAAPTERVFDYADVLTDMEEEKLREYIAEEEHNIEADIVIVTMNQAVEGIEAQKTYGYRYTDWELNMRDYADNFYDENNFGYDTIHGNGVLLLDNWYEGQAGSWMTTTGSVYHQFSSQTIDSILDDVYDLVEENPYEAYRSYIKGVSKHMQSGITGILSLPVIFIIPTIILAIFVAFKWKGKEGENTVSASTYIPNGKQRINIQTDSFIRKTLTQRRIPRNDGGSSHGGVSHGGGGRRR